MADTTDMISDAPDFADDTDLALIRCLQEHPRASYSTIARMTNIPDTTVRRRVQALYESGRIRTVVLPGLNALGYTSSALLLIRTEPGRSRSVGETLRDYESVTYLSLTLSRHSLACIVRAKSLESLSALIENEIAAIPGIVEIESSVVTEVLRGWGGWRVPITQVPPD
jgi:DNA-binding Lrp family transcriptional regulator